MNRRGLSLLVGLGMLFALAQPARADGWIYFQNNVGATIIPVFSDGTRQTKIGPPFVAQLYLFDLSKGGWFPVSKPVPFGFNGRFAGGVLTIPGDYGGRAVQLQVRVWNGQLYPSWEEFNRAEFFLDIGKSEVFTEVLAIPPNEGPKPMVNFQSFVAGCRGNTVPDPRYVTTQEDHALSVAVGYFEPNPAIICFNPDLQSVIQLNGQPFFPINGFNLGLNLGTLSGAKQPFTYSPRLHTYGQDAIYYSVCGTGCYGTGAGLGIIYIDIAPSPARQRPTLFVSATRKPSLLGLNAHRYRIEQSADLNSWEPIGSATGNYTTVDLSPFVTAGTRAQFLRASEITGP